VRLLANETKACDTAPLAILPPRHAKPADRGPNHRQGSSASNDSRRSHSRPGDLADAQTLSEGMGTQPDQGVCRVDAQGFHDHARGLVDLDPLQRRQLLPAVLRLASGIPIDVGGNQVEQGERGKLGSGQAPGKRVPAQGTTSAPKKVQRPHVRGRQDNWQSEDRANPAVEHRTAEGGPALFGQVLEVGHEHRRAAADGVQARTLAESELQLVEPPAEFAAGSEGPAGGGLVHQRDGSAVDLQQVDADVTQQVGGVKCRDGPLQRCAEGDPQPLR